MNNISLDNPYLLFLLIPLVLIISIPFFIAVKKDNFNMHNITSYVCHIIICILLTLVIAKTTYEKVMTETSVYVLADCSYSSNLNLDTIDDYIEDLEDDLPKNSKMGIICFGADSQILTELGQKRKSVKEAQIDKSATDIYSALEYTASLFSEDVIKRIVLISDGKETNRSNIISLVDSLSKDDIYIDAIYLDNNLPDEVLEVQISEVESTGVTYKDIDESIYITIQSNYDVEAILSLYVNDSLEPIKEKVVKLTKGYNNVDMKLDTSVDGEFNYRLVIEALDDTSEFNNEYLFTQTIVSDVKILHITESGYEMLAAQEKFGDNATYCLIGRDKNIPYTVEALCDYDIIILDEVDVRNINNTTQFLSSLNMVVDEFGKTLITIGNTYIQNNDDVEELQNLSAMLPVNYGNSAQDKKLLAVVLDISKSLINLNEFAMAKEAACSLLDLCNQGDLVTVVGFSGEIYTISPVTSAEDIQSIKDKINAYELDDLENATYIAEALQRTYSLINPYLEYDKIVYVVSDGEPHMSNEDSVYENATALSGIGASISTINISATDNPYGQRILNKVALIGGGKYYSASDLDEIKELLSGDIANDLTESYIVADNINVILNRPKDDILEGVESLPAIKGYYYNSVKTNATSILNVEYVGASGKTYSSALYAYWKYGTGRVATFATSLYGNDLSNWTDDTNASLFFEGLLDTNIPSERISSPFKFSTESVGSTTDIIVDAPNVNSNSTLIVTITYPDKTVEDKTLVFDSENYITTIETNLVGKYTIHLTYTLGALTYEGEYVFNVSYLEEYNSFTIYEASNLYYMVSDNGQVSEDGKLELVNDNSYVMTYRYDFTTLFLSLIAVLFVVDIIIRKLRWKDIKTFFNRTSSKQKK